MDVQKISNNVRMQKWMTIIDECSKSDLPVKTWCCQNDISEQSYYYWLKKIRTQAVQKVSNKEISLSPIPMTNSLDERTIRMFTIGRKNWLFSNSVKGAESSAAAYSIIETAKANDLTILISVNNIQIFT